MFVFQKILFYKTCCQVSLTFPDKVRNRMRFISFPPAERCIFLFIFSFIPAGEGNHPCLVLFRCFISAIQHRHLFAQIMDDILFPLLSSSFSACGNFTHIMCVILHRSDTPLRHEPGKEKADTRSCVSAVKVSRDIGEHTLILAEASVSARK